VAHPLCTPHPQRVSILVSSVSFGRPRTAQGRPRAPGLRRRDHYLGSSIYPERCTVADYYCWP
jgi:hypothetical protein